MEKSKFIRSSKAILGFISFLIIAPLLIYTNCGQISDPTNTDQNESTGIHQKIFIDIAGEHIDGLKSDLSVEKFDRDGKFIAGGGTYPKCKKWIQEAYLKAPNSGLAQHFFGDGGVSISENTIVIGTLHDHGNQSTVTNAETFTSPNTLIWSGAAYVFARVNGSWEHQAYLKAANADSLDRFGNDVSVSGNTIVVGAQEEAGGISTIVNGPDASPSNGAPNAGAAYVFERNQDGEWAETAYLKAKYISQYDGFGNAVYISGPRIVVGMVGEDSNYSTIMNDGNASYNNDLADSGAVYVFVKVSGTGWTREAYIKPSNPDSNDGFGSSVAISGNRIVVGAPGEDHSATEITNAPDEVISNNDALNSGAAYVFVQNGNGWEHEAYLKSSNSEGTWTEIASGDWFGSSVAISGTQIVVGAPYESSNVSVIMNGSNASSDNSEYASGAAYVFARNGVNWEQQAYLKASNPDGGTDPIQGDMFGSSVAISGNRVVVSAPREDSVLNTIGMDNASSDDNSSENSGAAYVFAKIDGSWIREAYVKASNSEANDGFGTHVAISGNRFVVTAPGDDSPQNTINNSGMGSLDNSVNESGSAYVYWCKDGNTGTIGTGTTVDAVK